MKCIRFPDGAISRVPDNLAAQVVKTGGAAYCSKSVWKALKRKDSSPNPSTERIPVESLYRHPGRKAKRKIEEIPSSESEEVRDDNR